MRQLKEDSDSTQALNDLISKIRINVVAVTNTSEKENISNTGIDASTNFNSLINTYSQATLNNTERIILETGLNIFINTSGYHCLHQEATPLDSRQSDKTKLTA